jgi:hypothetical protein
MRIPKKVYYHKHLMYNAGIVLSRGAIVAICDSDAIVKDTFVETILQAFKQDPNIVLHLDQVRNNDRRFYPFNYPTIEEVIGEGSINWKAGKTTGLWDSADILHTRNYGACMAAARDDLIKIGGADEHIDYLGHVCGPYEMTFRLINKGRREVWHPAEFLYHVWHPGQAGEKNYIGPHDGRHMSTRALLARLTGRNLPFLENSAIQSLRLSGNRFSPEDICKNIVSVENLRSWSTENIAKLEPRLWQALLPSHHPITVMRLGRTLLRVGIKEVKEKTLQLRQREVQTSERPLGATLRAEYVSRRDSVFNPVRLGRFVRRILESHLYVIRCSKRCLQSLAAYGETEISLYGSGDIAEVVYSLTFEESIKIKNVYDDCRASKFHGLAILPIEECNSSEEKLMITSLVEIENQVRRLKSLGVPPERILVLQ